MEIGFIGAGRMGAGMSRRLLNAGHTVHVFDVNQETVRGLEARGAKGAHSLSELVSHLSAPRTLWIMLPLPFIEPTLQTLRELLSAGDIVIDGGNCFYKDDIRRALYLSERGIDFLDVGTSGGIWGADRGYCLMVGGSRQAFNRVTPILRDLAPGIGDITRTPGRSGQPNTSEEGFLYCGPSGSGHFAKMVHNGIEYGLMQAFAEGFDLLRNADRLELENGEHFAFDITEIAETWRRGSVISSWLLDLTAHALLEDPALAEFTGEVSDNGEGRWTIHTAIEAAVPVPVLTTSLFARFRSRVQGTFADKLLSAMRKKFGGHVEKP